ncbi:MAG: hypothetical protein SX243_10130 [Acidobacteriota bacterium]|nr:hypothetical protein [Acidobacteriota bacterium]
MLERFASALPRPQLDLLVGLVLLVLLQPAAATPMATAEETSATEEPTAECILEVSPPPLQLHWDEFPTAADIAYLENRTLSLRIRNESDIPLSTELFLKVRAGGRQVQRSVGTLELAPREESTMAVDLSLPEIDLSTLRFSGQLHLYSHSRDGEGSLVEHSSSSTVYFHPDSSNQGLWTYRREALARSFGNGDFRGEMRAESLQQQVIALVPELATGSFAAPVEAGDGRETPAH